MTLFFSEQEQNTIEMAHSNKKMFLIYLFITIICKFNLVALRIYKVFTSTVSLSSVRYGPTYFS